MFDEEPKEIPWLAGADAEGPLDRAKDAAASLWPDEDWPRAGARPLSSARGVMGEACDLEGSDKLGSSDEDSTICVVRNIWWCAFGVGVQVRSKGEVVFGGVTGQEGKAGYDR